MEERLDLHSSVQRLPGIGPNRARTLGKLGIGTIYDLLFWFPRRWEDRFTWQSIAQVVPGRKVTVKGKITKWEEKRPRRGLTITSFTLADEQSSILLVFFNQPFVKKQLHRGMEVVATGKAQLRFGQLQLNNPEWELFQGDTSLHSGRIVPVYPGTEGISPRLFRYAVHTALESCGHLIQEILPAKIKRKYSLPPRGKALREIHFPTGWEEVKEARKSLAFEELLVLQTGLLHAGSSLHQRAGITHRPDGPLLERFSALLPFQLTEAQERAIDEIRRDMEDEKPMNRLLQGDVGSGKTLIAAYALLKTVENGFQGVLMVPTEILAEQHYLNLHHLLAPLNVEIALLTGSVSGKARQGLKDGIRRGDVDLVIGTHAVIQEEVEFASLGLAVIDEQHRFGVNQRSQLVKKSPNCDLLVMTATPIPRTLAMVFYAELDVTVVDQLPPGRQPVATYWVGEKARSRVYRFLRQEISKERQAYIVCPLVEESDKLQVQAASKLALDLQNEVFPQLKVGLLHGRMPVQEKEEVMAAFRKREIDILVCTTVIEVGVDVPNATVMVVEGAERFGLSQLHQLRGRVGRGKYQSFCILVGSPTTDEGRERLRIMTETGDGFELAEADLKLRGPGEFFGTRQSGFPELKVANLVEDLDLLAEARNTAKDLLREDPGLSRPCHQPLRKALEEFFGFQENQRRSL